MSKKGPKRKDLSGGSWVIVGFMWQGYSSYVDHIQRIDWLRSVGCQPDASGEGIVIANAFCNFYRQLEYPNDVLLKTYVSDPGRTTIESWATMEYAHEPGIIRAAGGATMIWVDFPKQKAANLPDWLRTLAE